jgi:glutamate formiminotransferase
MTKIANFRFKESDYEFFKATCQAAKISMTKAVQILIQLFCFDDNVLHRVIMEAKRSVE